MTTKSNPAFIISDEPISSEKIELSMVSSSGVSSNADDLYGKDCITFITHTFYNFKCIKTQNKIQL